MDGELDADGADDAESRSLVAELATVVLMEGVAVIVVVPVDIHGIADGAAGVDMALRRRTGMGNIASSCATTPSEPPNPPVLYPRVISCCCGCAIGTIPNSEMAF